ncbi:MAG: type II toxin-antitoxin system VapC family toxin [Acidobacteriota bacterium]
MIVLDTHTWVWWVSGSPRLSGTARQAIDRSLGEHGIYLSSISVWEVALLAKSGRLRLSIGVEDWIAKSEALPFLNFVAVDNRIALRSTQLPEPLHSDPADRIIIATTLSLRAKLITKDKKLANYPYVETLW